MKIIHKLLAGMMPPSGAKRPDPAILDALATTLETRIDAAAAGHPHPGGRTFQRLNRLLGVDFVGATPFWRASYALEVPAMTPLVAHGADPNVPTMKPPSRRRGGSRGGGGFGGGGG